MKASTGLQDYTKFLVQVQKVVVSVLAKPPKNKPTKKF